jgi:hygromycin-B 4-O-kinase
MLVSQVDSAVPRSVIDFIGRRFGKRAGALAVLGAGEWSRAYAMALDGRDVVVRFGAQGDDFAKDQVMAASSADFLPIPRVLEVGESPEGFFAVSERAAGEALDGLDEAGMRAVLPGLLTALDAISAVAVPAQAGFGIWSPDGRAAHASWADALLAIGTETQRVPGWRAALARSAVGVAPFRAGLARLADLAPALPAATPRLVHGDLLNRNVLVAGDRVTAVLDWGNSLYGDHLYDAAWLLYWWPWYPKWNRIDIRGELYRHWRATDRTPLHAGIRLLACQIHIGLDAIAYCAFKHRWNDVTRNARTVQALAGQPTP